jgi:hypothetical protein
MQLWRTDKDNTFHIIRTTRTNFSNLVDGLSDEELNLVPGRFNNNIGWNFGHIIVIQQTLCYIRMGFESKIEPALIERFRKGSKPEQWITKEEIALFKTQLTAQVDELEKDVASGFFDGREYEKLSTSYGVEINSLEDSIHYLATHDALHYGYALALRKALK